MTWCRERSLVLHCNLGIPGWFSLLWRRSTSVWRSTKSRTWRVLSRCWGHCCYHLLSLLLDQDPALVEPLLTGCAHAVLQVCKQIPSWHQMKLFAAQKASQGFASSEQALQLTPGRLFGGSIGCRKLWVFFWTSPQNGLEQGFLVLSILTLPVMARALCWAPGQQPGRCSLSSSESGKKTLQVGSARLSRYSSYRCSLPK